MWRKVAAWIVFAGASTGCAQPYFTSSGTDAAETNADGASSDGPRPTVGGGDASATASSTTEDGASAGDSSGQLETEDGGSTEVGDDDAATTAACGDGIDVYEDDSMTICPPQRSTTERIVECLCTYDPPVLDPAVRPTDAGDPLYYVNRWYSIDPCFPFTPGSGLLQHIRDTYINAVDDLEPEMLTQCGDYEQSFIQVPPGFTNDNDQLLDYAWSSPVPAGHESTLLGEPVGIDGQIGFAPMFAAAAEEGIQLFVQSGFRSLQTQADLFEYYAGVEGDPALAAVYSAWPSHSEHQLGTTADVGYVVDGSMVSPFDPLEADLHASEAVQWIRANAHRFGIVTTYQPRRVHVHQYKPEPWHLRFVGIEASGVMNACSLSTEELLAFRYQIEPLPEFIRMDLVHDAVLEGGWDPTTCAD